MDASKVNGLNPVQVQKWSFAFVKTPDLELDLVKYLHPDRFAVDLELAFAYFLATPSTRAACFTAEATAVETRSSKTEGMMHSALRSWGLTRSAIA